SFKTLLATIKTARQITHQRDCETGAHLDRMSRYSRLIARKLKQRGTYDFSDEFIEHVFVFSPLHDIGKIGIPDSVLLKPGKLDHDEFALMATHPTKGREIIDCMLDNFDLDRMPHVEILRNIAQFHHEAVNGSGYPDSLAGEAIPIEARIVAVADVFDALTSERPYKHAWSIDEAFADLRRLAGVKLDHDCVDALLDSRTDIEDIQRQFQEDTFG
ncbi:MAG: phosphohydrolase, partial [Thiotrichales bacterium SG8_50]